MVLKNLFFNRDTGKIKKAAVGSVITVPAAAMVLAVPFIFDREGYAPKAFFELGKVWSYCYGETTNVERERIYTKSECQELGKSRIAEFMYKVDQLIVPEVKPETLAAFTSFSYNIGIAGFERSAALKNLNQGNLQQACDAMLNWYKAAGRDCRGRNSGCYGVWLRRQDERELCLQGGYL